MVFVMTGLMGQVLTCSAFSAFNHDGGDCN